MVNYTNWSNVTGIQEFMSLPNTTTGGWFWNSIVWLIFFVIMLSLFNFGWTTAILSASFIAFVISLLLAYMGLVSWFWTTSVFVGLIIVVIMYIILENRNS